MRTLFLFSMVVLFISCDKKPIASFRDSSFLEKKYHIIGREKENIELSFTKKNDSIYAEKIYNGYKTATDDFLLKNDTLYSKGKNMLYFLKGDTLVYLSKSTFTATVYFKPKE